ncbi:DUF4369 domain-containing protein [Croceiramulus getboli]|nr:DUF4369 domain-containing protein [Flavobacteriaceae bacterium YJPT1-3]
MKRPLLSLFILILIVSCSQKKDFTLSGTVSGLKKGTLYLEKLQDTLLVRLDSVVIDGDPAFELATELKEPEVLYLHLEKKDASDYDDRILFFAEPGEMTLTTSLENFERQAAITGSENQAKLEEYTAMIMRFNDRNLDLLKASFEAQQKDENEAILAADQQMQALTKRRYLYTVNYALNNKNLEIAPYLALSEIFDANVTYLDTIYKSLAPKVQRSRYGKELKDFIKDRKAQE